MVTQRWFLGEVLDGHADNRRYSHQAMVDLTVGTLACRNSANDNRLVPLLANASNANLFAGIVVRNEFVYAGDDSAHVIKAGSPATILTRGAVALKAGNNPIHAGTDVEYGFTKNSNFTQLTQTAQPGDFAFTATVLETIPANSIGMVIFTEFLGIKETPAP